MIITPILGLRKLSPRERLAMYGGSGTQTSLWIVTPSLLHPIPALYPAHLPWLSLEGSPGPWPSLVAHLLGSPLGSRHLSASLPPFFTCPWSTAWNSPVPPHPCSHMHPGGQTSPSSLCSSPLGLVGLSLSYALSLTGLLSGLVSSFTQTETMLVSVERLEEYSCDLPQEPQGQLPRVGLHSHPAPGPQNPRGPS